MTATNKQLQGAGPVLRNRAIGLLAWISLTMPFSAAAENVLQDISFAPGASGRVDITLTMSGSDVDAQVFTTEQPPRIAIDLPGTRNAVAQRRLSVGAGATSAISAVEAGGRTRVVIDLFRPASYETRLEGNSFVLSVAGNAGSTTAAPATGAPSMMSDDPAKQIAGALELANVDFRRTAEGAGRVVLTFNGEGAAADMRTEGQRVIVDLPGIAIPGSLVQKIDVIDFATPVQYVESTDTGGGSRVILSNTGAFESMAYQTGNEYVLEISPPRAPEVVDGSEVIDGEGAYVGKPVTFNFQDIPVRTVLQLIAEESGLNVVAADTVAGNVTLRLINVPWDQALEIVLRAKGLDQRRDGNVVWVAPQSELASYERAQAEARLAAEASAPLLTEYIQINYANAADIASLLTENSKVNQTGATGAAQQQQTRGFLSQRGSVTSDARTNTILLNDTAEKIGEIRSLIALLDRPVDQVLIEARIVIASEDFARELGARFGVSGGYEDGDGNLIATTGSLGGASTMAARALGNRLAGNNSGLPILTPGSPSTEQRLNVNLPVAGSTGAIGFAILGADYLLDLELSALESEGRGEVVSSPRVITANQREALITQGDEFPYVTSSNQGGVINQTVTFKEILLELKVTPTITKDGRVAMTLALKKDEISGFVATDEGDIPSITKRSVSTAVLVDNGQTVVVGGVYEFSSREDVAKVPFLADVPVLGNLFKRRGRSTGKAELLIFVSPTIMVVPGRSE
jgi:type IV pilus assembly protein PilQ